MLAILDIGNFRFSDDPKVRYMVIEGGYPMEEFLSIGRFLGHIITVVKLTAAKCEYYSQTFGTELQSIWFWLCWTLMIFNIQIILFNFIIAQVNEIYSDVMESI